MDSYAEYFSCHRYKPKWFIGDRVFGYYNKIPFVGTVGNDSLVNEEQGPRVSVFLDLPICHNKQYRSIVTVRPKDLKKLNIL